MRRSFRDCCRDLGGQPPVTQLALLPLSYGPPFPSGQHARWYCGCCGLHAAFRRRFSSCRAVLDFKPDDSGRKTREVHRVGHKMDAFAVYQDRHRGVADLDTGTTDTQRQRSFHTRDMIPPPLTTIRQKQKGQRCVSWRGSFGL